MSPRPRTSNGTVQQVGATASQRGIVPLIGPERAQKVHEKREKKKEKKITAVEESEELGGLFTLDLTVLDGLATEEVVKLDGEDGGRASLILEQQGGSHCIDCLHDAS